MLLIPTYFLRFSFIFLLFNSYLSLSYATSPSPSPKQALQGRFAVLPLQNKTANSALDWLSIALQESWTIDLWYLPVGATEAFSQYGHVLTKSCPKMTLSCVQQQTLDDWQNKVKEKNYTHLIWGSYQQDKNKQLTIQLQLIDAKKGTILAKTKFSSDLEHITIHSGVALLTLLNKQGFSATTIEKKRVLYPETDQAEALKANALGYWTQQQYDSASKEEQKLLAIKWEKYLQQAVTIDNSDANAWNNLGWFFSITDENNHEKAKQAFQNALKANADHPDAIDGLGSIYRDEKNYTQAGNLLNTLSDIAPSMSHRYMTLITISQAMKDSKKTLFLLEKQLILSATIDDIPTLNLLGLTHYKQKNYLRALPLYQCIVALRERELGSMHFSTAASLNSLASIYKFLGEYQQAEFLYQRVLTIFKKELGEADASMATATILNNLAGLYRNAGEYSKAETRFKQALTIFEQQPETNSLNVATTLNNLAGLYQIMGAYNKAKPLYQRALDIKKRRLGVENIDTATGINNLAAVYHKLKKYHKAEDLYQQALGIRERKLGEDHLSVAISLNNLALLYYDMGMKGEIEQLYQRALKIIKKQFTDEHPLVAVGLNNLAGFYQTIGKYHKAEDLYQNALTIRAKKLGAEHPLTATSLGNLARLYEAINAHHPQTKQSLNTIIFLEKHAVNVLQTSRQKNLKLSKALKSSFIGNKETMYRALVTLLLSQNRLQEAEHVMAMYKEKEVADYYKKDSNIKDDRPPTLIGFNAEEQLWNKRYQTITKALYSNYQAYKKLKEKKALSEKEQQQIKQLEQTVVSNTADFNQFLQDISKPWTKNITKPSTTPNALQTTLAQLGKGTVIVNYFVEEDKLRILLTTPTKRVLHDSPISATALGQLIKNYRRQLEQKKALRGLSQTLHQHLIAPIEPELQQANAKTIMFSLDATLRYLPMAALHNGDSYLIERYKLSVYTPAVGYQALTAKPRTQPHALAMGVTDKATLPALLSGEKPYTFPALPYVAYEVKGIVDDKKIKDATGFIEGKIYLNEKAKKDVLIHALSKKNSNRFAIVHLATHFKLNKGNGYQSFLLLGEQTTLPIAELYRHPEVNFNGVDLLTVSACNTGKANNQGDGSEIESFAAIAQQKGAKAVLASLWAVDDRSTGELMQDFYRVWQQGNSASKWLALQQAQQRFIAQGKNAEKPECSAVQAPGMTSCADQVSYPFYSHPYYWAAFMLMGNGL